MELKEGMYVRTKDGKIFDCYVSEQMGKPIYYPKSSKTNGYIDYEEVYKKSKCIIDLIYVGDIIETPKGVFQVGYIENNIIKSIVTKEQFNYAKYEVE